MDTGTTRRESLFMSSKKGTGCFFMFLAMLFAAALLIKSLPGMVEDVLVGIIESLLM